jgi:hypothetical protein
MWRVLEPFPNPSIKASRLGIAQYPDTDFDVRRKTKIGVEVVERNGFLWLS